MKELDQAVNRFEAAALQEHGFTKIPTLPPELWEMYRFRNGQAQAPSVYFLDDTRFLSGFLATALVQGIASDPYHMFCNSRSGS